ncbi:MAG TPA: HEAT repeat domain-containing protein [Pirellulales bacterium]|jgi:HEAT repeat protein|nr:HEAT repeat domain-containing protein [Pirellulales bacterium]
MHTTRSLTRCRLLFSALVLLSAASVQAAEGANGDKEKERGLIQQLQSDAAPADKALACKQLAIYGSPAAVSELAKLLTDEHLASWARIALEAIPGSASDEALRNAIPKLHGQLLVGTINSIGVRRDADSVEPLAGRLQDQDAEVASAAAVALGNIGNPAATKALRHALAGAPPAVRSAVAEGCVLCAERSLADGHAGRAAAIYDELRKADLPKQRLIEATRGAILARDAEGLGLLVEQLRSSDRDFFRLGLTTAREVSGPDVAKTLVAELVGATPDRAALLLQVVADRHDTAVLPAVLEAASSGPQQVRIAALEVLPRLGDDSCVQPLLQIATGDDRELAAAAKTALAGLPGEKVDADITSRLADAQGNSLPVLIELVGLRRINAKDYLLKASDDPQAAIRSAAWTALGATVGINELSTLVSEAIKPKHPEDAQVAQHALRAACIRMPESEACADQLSTAMAGGSTATKCMLLEILGAMGGEKALQALGAAGKDSDPQLQDAATRALGQWMNTAAAPVLLDVAKNAPEEKYQVRALRGYLRLARQFVKQDGQRVQMCKQAYAAAHRTAEQKLVLEVLGRCANLEALRLAVKAAQVPELKQDGTRVAVAIYGKLPNKSPEAKKLLAQVQPD